MDKGRETLNPWVKADNPTSLTFSRNLPREEELNADIHSSQEGKNAVFQVISP